jgi:DNA-binding transcriptional LysR family regulator
MDNFDFNLLRVFDAVWRHRHLGLASKELELSQPALSHSLNAIESAIRCS